VAEDYSISFTQKKNGKFDVKFVADSGREVETCKDAEATVFTDSVVGDTK